MPLRQTWYEVHWGSVYDPHGETQTSCDTLKEARRRIKTLLPGVPYSIRKQTEQIIEEGVTR